MENTHDTHKVTPRFFFLSLGVLISLIASVTSFLSLAFDTLNHAFPDAPNTYGSYDFDSMRSSIAMLVILFPAFIILSAFWVRALKPQLSRGDAVIKRWMLYLVIFLSSLIVVADLVTLVRYFISGEITVRFIVKVLIALVTACLVGGYYLRELSRKSALKGTRIAAACIATAFVLAVVIYSFAVMGSPAVARGEGFDDTRVNDLQSLQSRIISYWQSKGTLPSSLSDLNDPLSDYTVPLDPQSNAIYAYDVTGTDSFQLCATFSEPSQVGNSDPLWTHPAGNDCFSRTIDATEYPPLTKTPQPVQ